MSAAASLKILSPAKVNLFLRVAGKREDGYHDIFSLVQPVALYDEIFLTVGQGDGITVRSTDGSLPQGRENIAYRAAELFLEKAGIKKKVLVEIDKKIPVSSGLGGGSSDAAGVLMGLNEILGCAMSEGMLMRLGLECGSDVPFFILNGPAFVRGRGETIERVALPPYDYILINPGFGVS
ncbi:MAG: 4-(cytidine 5'-diphospho)-2-C-methyl-D-erythritol kinase, partial [Deltaproteobacteria bacterium]|nr:4-(cytidine 5'-diphospho)-2-C-methyl-D-erythritol kinase [Deltaproteobacteria bacterium]